MSGILSQSSTSGIVGEGGSGWVTVGRADIAAVTPAYDNLLSLNVKPDTLYKIMFQGLNDASGGNGYTTYVRASIDVGSNWLTADYTNEFTYGSTGASQNSGRFNLHSGGHATGIGLDHNHQTGFGLSGELNFHTNATTDGSIKVWGHTNYDSDNQGDWGNSRLGGHWNSSSLANLNYIRIVSNNSSFLPDSGYITVLKLNGAQGT